MEQETIMGFDIPMRLLSDEEKYLDITLERFNLFHYDVGEDFCDQCGSLVNHTIVAGFLMAKHPEWSKEFLEVVNSKYGEVLGLLQVYEDHEEEGCDLFYSDFAEFLNLTEGAKVRVNQILVQIYEYYN